MLLVKAETFSTCNNISPKNYWQKIAVNCTDRFPSMTINTLQVTVVFRAVWVFLYLSFCMAPSVHTCFSTSSGGQEHWKNFPIWLAFWKEAYVVRIPPISSACEHYQTPCVAGFSGLERSEGRKTTKLHQAHVPKLSQINCSKPGYRSHGGGFEGSRGIYHLSETVFSVLITQNFRNIFQIYF